MNINRGSEWNKWDLHIHTPDTSMANEFKDNDWEKYLSIIEEKNVKALGITDYFSIENYFKAKKYKEKGRLKNVELLLPNVELRLDNFTKEEKAVNLHVIFSDEVADEVQNLFLNELKFISNGSTYSCNKDGIIRLGKKALRKEIAGECEAYQEGINQMKVDIDDVIKALEANSATFNGNYLIGASNKSSDGVSGIRGGQQESLREKLFNCCDFIFSSNPNDKNYFAGNNEYGLNIPCIHGSDAHSYKKICEPDEKRYTWIKSEISFEGLKQIKHEPKRRVKIQEQCPDEKINYNIIDKVQFNDKERLLGKNSIYFSSGLNVIIGGKSSGKSILLFKIAQTVNKSIIDKIEKEDLWKNSYYKTDVENIETQIFWKDNTYSSIEDNDKQLLYIPQMYINNLAEKYQNELLQRKIESLILENNKIYKVHADFEEYMKNYISSIEIEIEKIKNALSEKEEINESIRSIGNKKSIEEEIERLRKILNEEIENSKLDEKEERELKSNENQKIELFDLRKTAQKVLKETESLGDIVEYKNNEILKSLEETEYCFEVENIKVEYMENLKEIESNFLEKLKSHKEAKDKSINRYTTKIESIEETLQPIRMKMKKRESIEKIRIQLQTEKNKNEQINAFDNKIQKLEKLKTASINRIKDIVNKYIEKANLYVQSIQENYKDYKGIRIIPEPTINSDKFNEIFMSKIDRRKLNNTTIKNITDGLEDKGAIQNYSSLICNYIDELLNIENNVFKKDIDRISMVKYLAIPYYEIKLNLSDGNDKITEMSPGKSGLIILKLLTYTSKEQFPILIDQPEDNLDNRTISSELVNLIRDISTQRQVFMVTHNANLAVLTDAENIIVANQDVSDNLKENKKYKFEYRNGALESITSDNNLGTFYGASIQELVFDILEGGKEAFKKRENKYINLNR